MLQELARFGLTDDIKETQQDINTLCYWKVLLSNGEVVVQNDIKGSAWIKLGEYLKAFPDVGIVRYGIHVGGNSYYIPDAQWGYYFSMGLLQQAAAVEPLRYYVMGWQPPMIDDLTCFWVKIPELSVINSYQKTAKECFGPALILNPPGLTIPGL